MLEKSRSNEQLLLKFKGLEAAIAQLLNLEDVPTIVYSKKIPGAIDRVHYQVVCSVDGKERSVFVKDCSYAQIETYMVKLQKLVGLNSYDCVAVGDEYSVMTWVSGRPLHAFLNKLDRESNPSFFTQLGKIAAFEYIFGQRDSGIANILYDETTESLTAIDFEGMLSDFGRIGRPSEYYAFFDSSETTKSFFYAGVFELLDSVNASSGQIVAILKEIMATPEILHSQALPDSLLDDFLSKIVALEEMRGRF